MSQVAPPPYSANRIPQESASEEHAGGNIQVYFHIIRKRKWIILIALLFSLVVAVFKNITQKPVYSSAAELILQPKETTQTTSQGQSGGSFMQDPTFMMTQIRLIRSHSLAERAMQKLEKEENREHLLRCFLMRSSRKKDDGTIFSEKERQALIASIPGILSANQVERGARFIAISATCYSARAVALLADAAANSYVEMNYETQVQSFQKSFSLISQSLTEIREKIKTGEIAIQKVDSEIKLLKALKIYEEKHPSVIQLRVDIPDLAQKLNEGIKNLQAMQFTSQRKDFVQLVMIPHVELKDLEPIEADLHIIKPILEQEVSTIRGMYDSMFKKLQEVELGSNAWVDAKVVDPASIPSVPIRPNKKMNLMIAFVFGILIGGGLAFFLEYLDSSIRNLEDVKSYLKLFPLGMVPEVEMDSAVEIAETSNENSELMSNRVFWLANDSGVPLYVAEAYRIIRTNLAFGSVDESVKVLQLTSAVKGEGKTTTAANLSVSLAQAGNKTLLVDADMRRPSVHRILGLDGIEEGLSEALANGKSWESILEPTRTPNLFCIPAGMIPPNPAELLSSKRMKSLIEQLRGHFDKIIIDSPPVISVADASIIASHVDGIILVARSGFIPRHLSLQAKNTLTAVNGKIIGCVLNGIQSQHQPYYYYRYYHKYGNYYGEEINKNKTKNNFFWKLSPWIQKIQLFKEPLLAYINSVGEIIKKAIKGEEDSKKMSKDSNGES